jgi:hypothetical protein
MSAGSPLPPGTDTTCRTLNPFSSCLNLLPLFSRLMHPRRMELEPKLCQTPLATYSTREIPSGSSWTHTSSLRFLRSLKPEKDPLSPIGEISYDPLPVLLAHFTHKDPVALSILSPESLSRLLKLFLKTRDPLQTSLHDNLLIPTSAQDIYDFDS